jgi:hypothetical protein
MSAPSCRKRPQLDLFWCALTLLLPTLNGLAATPPTLSNPAWTGGQFQFVLNGQTNVSYIIESSADLNTWTAVLTNNDSFTTRLITFPATGSVGFWRVSRVPGPLFANAIAVRGLVDLGGSGWVDSFDSADPNFSTDGRYDPAKRKAGGDIASALGTNGSIILGSTQVAGVVHTEPGGIVTLGPNGGVGSLAWLNNPSTAGMIEPGYVREDMNLSFPNPVIRMPGPLHPGPSSGIVNGVAYTYVLGNGNYRRIGDLTLASAQSMIVTGKAVIYVTSRTTVTASGSIIIATNASVIWYGGGDFSIAGQGIINSSSMATNVTLIGLSTCTSLTYSGSSPFIGTIYTPTADVRMTGADHAVGAVAGKTFKITGTLDFHFDENLKRDGPFF